MTEQLNATKKVKKLKLKPFDLIVTDRINVTLCQFTVTEDNEGKPQDPEIGYGAVLLLWVTSSEKQKYPIMMHVPIAGSCFNSVAYEAIEVASGMCDTVSPEVRVFDENNEVLFVLDADDIFASVAN